MRTPDEIKKGLECCVNDMEPGDECEGCPYFENPSRFHWICHGNKVWSDALALIQQLQDENAEKDAKIQQLEADKQQLEGLLTHMNQLRDAAAGRALSMEERVHQLKAERDAAVTFLPRKCYLCKHVGNKMGDAPCPSFCEYITLEECPNWQWRGVQKEDDDA